MATVDDLGATPKGGVRRLGPVSVMIRLVSVVAVVAFSAFVGGFLVFADQVTNSRPPARPQADGIVALTGGAQRIEGAVDLLGRGSASRLLISGVYERTSPDALADRTPKLAALLDCCVDIGYAAHDTKGNARETREWARVNGYDSLIVVTSAYHMPRSLAEIARELPDVRLVPFPIHTEKLTEWYANRQTLRLLLVEYTKYIVARLG